MSYALAVLVNNVDYLDIMLRNMPKHSVPIDLIIINETRLGNKIDQIRSVCEKNKFPEAQIFGSALVTKMCLEEFNLSEQGRRFAKIYTMSMNILAQYFILKKLRYKKVLFVDDDVTVNKDLAEIFTSYDYAFSKIYFSYDFKDNPLNETDFDRDWKELIGFTNNKEWKQRHISGGQRLYSREENFLKIYKSLLIRFFENINFYEVWEKGRAGKRGYKWNSFYMDQNFENALIYQANIWNENLHPYVKIILGKKSLPANLATLINKTITHYTVGHKINDKIEYLRMLQAKGVLK